VRKECTIFLSETFDTIWLISIYNTVIKNFNFFKVDFSKLPYLHFISLLFINYIK
jgi:hypothetical protein